MGTTEYTKDTTPNLTDAAQQAREAAEERADHVFERDRDERMLEERKEKHLDALRAEVRRLALLLEDPHPGLATWRHALSERLGCCAAFHESAPRAQLGARVLEILAQKEKELRLPISKWYVPGGPSAETIDTEARLVLAARSLGLLPTEVKPCCRFHATGGTPGLSCGGDDAKWDVEGRAAESEVRP